MDQYLAEAIVEEAAKKASLLWLNPLDRPDDPHPVWQLWIGSAPHLVCDGPEQPLPDLGELVQVTARAKDGNRLASWVARPVQIRPDSQEWPEVTAALAAKRLNAPADQSRRWATECRVLRLEATGQLLEHPGDRAVGSLARAVRPAAAATRSWQPFRLGRRRR